MPKKFFDIIPPQKNKNNSFPELAIFPKKNSHIADKKIEKAKFVPNFSGKKKGGKIVIALWICLLLFAAAGIFSFYLFGKVKIDIWPKTDILNVTKAITVKTDEKIDSSLWLEKGIVPGEIFKDQKSESQEFFSSGKVLKEEKATGIIKIYNAYSESPQSLVIGTRFVSADGKLFKSVKKETIPGEKRDSKGKLTPGEIDIEVVAAEIGKDYNIGPTTFSVPGFNGTPKYTSIYGKSFSDMKGGFKGEISQVTQEDLDGAEAALSQKLYKESKEFLTKSLPQGYVFIDGAISQNILEKDFSVEKGAEAKSFTLKIKVESKAIIFKKSDMDKIVKGIIDINMPKDKKLEEDKTEVNYSFKSLGFNNEINKIDLDIIIKAKIYQNINLEEIKKTLLGKSFYEVKSLLGDQPDISKVKIEPGFFWRKRVPDDINKVDMRLNLD